MRKQQKKFALDHFFSLNFLNTVSLLFIHIMCICANAHLTQSITNTTMAYNTINLNLSKFHVLCFF